MTVCQDTAESLDEAVGIDAIIIDFPRAFDLVPHDRLLSKLTASGVDARVVVWVREFLVGRTPRGTVGRNVMRIVHRFGGRSVPIFVTCRHFNVYKN